MKTPLLLAVLSLAAVSAPALSPSVESAPVTVQEEKLEFRKNFQQAMKIKATDEMARLVKTEVHNAVLVIIEICELIANRPDDELETEIAALRVAWKTAMKTDFVDTQYEYFSLLRPEYKKARRQAIQRYRLKYADFAKAEAAKDQTELPGIAVEMEEFAKAFTELGDHYMASQCWTHVAHCYDETLRGENADLRKACAAWGEVVKSRGAIHLKDPHYNVCKTRFDTLELEGFGTSKRSKEAREAKAAKAAAAIIHLAPSFEMVPTLNAVRRPYYTADDVYQMWTQVDLGDKGSSGKFNTMEKSPALLRTGAAKVAVDVNGDGQGDVDVPMTGKPTPIQIKLGEGEEERDWAFLAVVGNDQDTYQGFKYNLAPQDKWMMIFTAPAGSLVTTLGETRLQILDDNMDGIYGSYPKEWGWTGVRNGSFQPDMDSVIVGEAKVARPWSEFQEIGGAWYKFESLKGGKEIKAAPIEFETGTLKHSFKGGKVDWLVVRGVGKLENAYFNLLEDKKGVTVPAGQYNLVAGQISKGKRAQTMKALILPSDRTPTWDVEVGKTTTIELGAPFGFDFDFTQDDENVTLQGDSIVVTGKANETYQRLWNCAVEPEVLLRKAGGKRGKSEKKFLPAKSQEEVDALQSLKHAWFPVTEPIPKKKKGEDVEVQLFQKKNKLFGKIESVWKGK